MFEKIEGSVEVEAPNTRKGIPIADRIAELLMQGVPIIRVAEQLGTARPNVRKVARERGIKTLSHAEFMAKQSEETKARYQEWIAKWGSLPNIQTQLAKQGIYKNYYNLFSQFRYHGLVAPRHNKKFVKEDGTWNWS